MRIVWQPGVRGHEATGHCPGITRVTGNILRYIFIAWNFELKVWAARFWPHCVITLRFTDSTIDKATKTKYANYCVQYNGHIFGSTASGRVLILIDDRQASEAFN
jgi:hypothetical protein